MARSPKVLYRGKHLQFVRADGWEYAERPNASGVVAVAAVTPYGRLVLTEQYRRAVDRRVIDLPAGLAGDEAGGEDESLETAAQRELLEETGWRAERLERLAEFPTTPGLSSETVTLFRALDIKRSGRGGGTAHEDITVHTVALDRVAAWLKRKIAAGRAVDPKVYVALYFLAGR